MNRVIAFILLCCVGVALPACSLAPRYERPEMAMLEEWRSLDMGTEPLAYNWWERFNDPVLNAMVAEALANNQNIEESLGKVDSAQAQLGIGSTAFFPTVMGQAAASSDSASERTPNARGFNSLTGMVRTPTKYSAALNAAWELDLWGKYRNTYTALSDILLATKSGTAATRLLVAGQTVQSYFAMLALDMQLNTARNTLKTREDAFGIYTSRYKEGVITELDWLRAKSEVEVARAQLHTITVALDSAEASLAVLLGRSPRDIISRAMERGTPIAELPAPPVLPEGLPSEILLRRPDIRSAEFALMASNANIGVARAEFFPSITLTGMLGTLSSAVGTLFTGPAGMWSYGAAGAMPILDFGRTWYNVKDAEAQKRQAVAVYRQTVQAAFKDVRTALTAQRESDAIVQSHQALVRNMRRVTQLAQLQYDNGYTDYLTVLDAERQLFNAELQLASSMRDRLNAVVGVCMALGGGWEDAEIREATEKATKTATKTE